MRIEHSHGGRIGHRNGIVRPNGRVTKELLPVAARVALFQEGLYDGPVEILLKDRIFLVNGLLWLAAVMAILYLGTIP